MKHVSLGKLLPALMTAGLLGLSGNLAAAPILGGQLYYAGGSVTVTTQPVSSGYTSELWLFDSSFNRVGASYITLDEPAGVTVDITSLITGAGFGIGDELIFGIYVQNTQQEFYMGPASRNPDGVLHAAVDVISASPVYTADVGFEDLTNGGDMDYDDNVFRFEGGVRVNPAPEPGTLLLAGIGALGLGLMRRRPAQG
jgi:hypothetical protein